ncbi:MAG: M16 family metallopeptidase [Bacteroidales bacterium]
MIKYTKYLLDNGLRLIVHQDTSTPIATVNLLYNVGSKHETPDKTGFAHLFEHLMFEGSVNIPAYDTPLQIAGGENNAFTSNDITNYYLTLPLQNIETAFWLESDRMLGLNLTKEKLEIQKNVVIEEFNQRYINQPYGDAHLTLRPMAYKVHPYRWPTIGRDMSHIRNATLEDVKEFFYHHYAPNNAILTVVANEKPEKIRSLVEKWFGSIPRREITEREIPQEPPQKEPRKKTIKNKDVPHNVLFKAYHICGHTHPDYHATDLISDILANGKSSRLYQSMVKEKKIFSQIDAHITGDIDPGLLMINGSIANGTPIEKAESELNNELKKLTEKKIPEQELEKVKNKVEATHTFSLTSALYKAMNLSYYELLGDAEIINKEMQAYRKIKPEDIQRVSSEVLQENNCSTLYYLSKQ